MILFLLDDFMCIKKINESIKPIVEKYGSYDYLYRNKKVLYTKVSFKEKTLVNNKWYFQFSKEKDKIFLKCMISIKN